jgi:Flp pilus assembly protein TadG
MTALALLRCRRGLVALEFALILPFMLLLLCGVAEVTSLYSADSKIVQAAQSCADLVAQEKSIDGTKVDDIAEAVRLTLDPMPEQSLAFRISSVVFDASTGAPSVAWQRTIGAFNSAGAPSPPTSAVGLGNPGDSVIIVDLSYGYTPVFRNILPQGFTIEELAAARPRRVRQIACSGC